jgi:Fur family ferric uptake transcriptional regulator
MADDHSRQIEQFTSALKSRGRFATKQRVRVLEYVLGTRDHFDAEDVLRALKTDKTPVSRATVYRALASLEKCNLVRKVSVGNGRWLFEKVPGKRHHQHIYCAECGKIMEFSEPMIEKRIEEVSRAGGFTLRDHSFQIAGLCNECKRRLEKDKGRVCGQPTPQGR